MTARQAFDRGAKLQLVSLHPKKGSWKPGTAAASGICRKKYPIQNIYIVIKHLFVMIGGLPDGLTATVDPLSSKTLIIDLTVDSGTPSSLEIRGTHPLPLSPFTYA
jgi:hypothetical protein